MTSKSLNYTIKSTNFSINTIVIIYQTINNTVFKYENQIVFLYQTLREKLPKKHIFIFLSSTFTFSKISKMLQFSTEGILHDSYDWLNHTMYWNIRALFPSVSQTWFLYITSSQQAGTISSKAHQCQTLFFLTHPGTYPIAFHVSRIT